MAYSKVEVSYRIDSNGRRVPEQFVWAEHRFAVLSVGRRWQDEQGEHILVQAAGSVYELLFDQRDLTWWVKPPAGARMVS